MKINVTCIKNKLCLYCSIQWTPLNGITDNGLNRLMESDISRFTSPKLLCHTKRR